jgi:hypothetical protein
MILDFFQNFHFFVNFFPIINYILVIVGSAIVLYVVGIFYLSAYSLFRSKNLDAIKAIHIVSVIEVYAIACFIFGITLVTKIPNLMFLKLVLFLIIVIFNGITATRLIAKTAYFYNLRFKKLQL